MRWQRAYAWFSTKRGAEGIEPFPGAKARTHFTRLTRPLKGRSSTMAIWSRVAKELGLMGGEMARNTIAFYLPFEITKFTVLGWFAFTVTGFSQVLGSVKTGR
jgi:hypothetical protein